MSVIIIITPPPKGQNANKTSTAVALPDGSGAIVDANGISTGTFTSVDAAIAYLEHMNRHPVG